MEPEVVEEEVSLFEEESGEQEAPATEQPSTELEDENKFEIPTKFAGKSLEDVIQSYVNVEKELGRKSNEVGELRKLTDQILKNQVEQGSHRRDEYQADINDEVDFDDFLSNPVQAVDRVLQENPRIRKLEQELNQRTTDASRRALLDRHKDADEIVSSPQFQKWAQESPGRLRMLQEAHSNFDVDIASDLIDVYKTTRKVGTEEAVVERDSIAKADLKKAQVETGRSPVETKKYFKRSELIQLKIQNPARYSAMYPEIEKAYAEGRVK
jgi:hypothetical protein